MIQPEQSYHILFLASWYPNKVEPQNGNFIQRHAEAVALNCKVACLHVLSIPDMQGFEVDTRWNNNVYEVVVYFEKTSKFLPYQKFNKYLKAHRLGYEKILSVFKKIDLVHLNVFFPAGVFALELKRRYELPFVITEHWTAFLNSNPHRFSFIERYFIKKIAAAAAMICPVSEDLKKALQNFGLKGPYSVVPNVVDTDLFQNATDKAFPPIHILHVSTLMDHHKNVSGLLRVIARLKDARQDFKLTLAGNKVGDFHQQNAKKLSIPSHQIEILDEIPLQDIAQLMQSAHIFVLFSNFENLPCVISEAHASGMVVIATDVGGVREMLEPSNGILIKAKDEQALFDALQNVMNQLDQYDNTNIRKAAIQRYSYQSVADQYTHIYSTTLANSDS